MIGVTENLKLISNLLASSAVEAEREPDAVRLMAVSKKQPLEKIIEAAAAGQKDFGENFVQEGLEKIAKTRGKGLIWHFIGHLQSNKTRLVAENFDWVHSVDRLKIAQRLGEQRPADLGPINICLQVNIDDESSKGGVRPEDVPRLARDVSTLDNVSLRGLMCLPQNRSDFAAQREPFARLREMAESMRSSGVDMDTLSMGMSGDFRAAIHEGATIVRIGTSIFGERAAG